MSRRHGVMTRSDGRLDLDGTLVQRHVDALVLRIPGDRQLRPGHAHLEGPCHEGPAHAPPVPDARGGLAPLDEDSRAVARGLLDPEPRARTGRDVRTVGEAHVGRRVVASTDVARLGVRVSAHLVGERRLRVAREHERRSGEQRRERRHSAPRAAAGRRACDGGRRGVDAPGGAEQPHAPGSVRLCVDGGLRRRAREQSDAVEPELAVRLSHRRPRRRAGCTPRATVPRAWRARRWRDARGRPRASQSIRTPGGRRPPP